MVSIKNYNGRAIEVDCAWCNRPFLKYKKRTNHCTGSRIAIRKSNCVCCSSNCSKQRARFEQSSATREAKRRARESKLKR